MSASWKKLLTQMSKFFAKGIFLNNESTTSKLPMNKLEPCSTISLEKWNESLTVTVSNRTKNCDKDFSKCISRCFCEPYLSHTWSWVVFLMFLENRVCLLLVFCLSLRDFKNRSIFIQKSFYISYIPTLFVLKTYA